MNFYPHHIGDYMTATAHLTWLEDAAYRRMLDLYYSREEALPADITRTARLVRATSKDERKAVETVLDEFFELTAEGWKHSRCEEEIEKARAAAERARANGKKGGRPPKGKKPEQSGDAANPEENESPEHGCNSANPEDSQEEGKDSESDNPEITHPVPVANPEITKSQAPITNTNTKELPQTPQAGLSGKPDDQTPESPSRARGISLKTFLEECSAKGERPIRDYSPLWAYIESVGLPGDFVALAWAEFLRRCLPDGPDHGKRQKDWRATFRKYVENNYLGLWAIGQEGNYFLTTKGRQAEKFQESKATA